MVFLKTQLNHYAVKVDHQALKFAEKATPNTLMTKYLKEGKADFLYKKCRQEFELGNFEKSFKILKEALKHRNDIDTEIFEKFIITKLKKLSSYKSGFIKNAKAKLENEDLENEDLPFSDS